MYCWPCGTVPFVVPGVPPDVHVVGRANLRRDAVGIDAQQFVDGVRTDISNAQRRVVVELLLDRQIPFLNLRSFRVGLYSLRRKSCAGRHACAAGRE